MTEEYKRQLLNYVTGNLETTSPTADEIFLEKLEIERNKWINFIPSYWRNFRYEGMVSGNELTSNLGILYGGFIDENGDSKGIITLINENFEPIQTFYKYSSGTDLRYIQYMNQAEDGTFYFIDDEVFSYSQREQSLTSQKRFVMINNITIPFQNQYLLNLRTSYTLPDNLRNFYCHNMFKDPNSSHYVFFGGGVDTTSSNYDYRLLKIFGLKINVGEINEWTSYVSQEDALFGSAFAQFNSNSEVFFRCLWTNVLNSSRTIDCYTKTYTGNPTNSQIKTFNFHPYIDEGFQKKQSVFMSIDEVYFVQNNQYWGVSGQPDSKYIGLYKHIFSTNQNETIFEKYLGEYDYTYQEYIMIEKNVSNLYIEYVNNYDITNATADYYIQRYQNSWNPILIGENKPFIYDRRSIYVKNNFNLLQIYSYGINPQQRNWYCSVIKEDYNMLNYNGNFYVDTNTLNPYKTRLYSNNSLIFARNLYNISKQDNMTMSSVEIPNNYLNDAVITQNDLISETNLQINSDNRQWNKNVYEVVNLNFLNTISVIDEDTNTPYIDSAIRVNNSITDINDYENTKCTKIRINYTDDTTKTESISWEKIDSMHQQTIVNLYVDKAIKSIDFISNDEQTIYLTKELEVIVGKYYAITQKIKIGV